MTRDKRKNEKKCLKRKKGAKSELCLLSERENIITEMQNDKV